jgi:plastocyanin
MSRRSQRVLAALSTAAVGSGLLAACVAANEAVAQPNPTFSTDDAFAFAPPTLTVEAGSPVTWRNKDEDPHTVVSGGGSFRSQALGSGDIFSFTFPAAGTFDYICSIHPSTHGTVVVTP